jgi:hypothetical protein
MGARGTACRIWPVALIGAALIVLLALPTLAQAGSVAVRAKACDPPPYPGSGYFTSLTVRGTSCATGKKLARAYYRCRTENGKGGRCERRVMGFSCTEKRNSIPTEITARVRCKNGNARVIHTYQQDL